jgi:hypothetical protein
MKDDCRECRGVCGDEAIVIFWFFKVQQNGRGDRAPRRVKVGLVGSSNFGNPVCCEFVAVGIRVGQSEAS